MRKIPLRKIAPVLLGLVVGLVGCQKESDQDLAQSRQTNGGQTIHITLEGEGDELRVAGLPSIPVDANGRKVNKLLADDVTQVPVHCVFRSSTGQSFAQTILWSRVPGTQKLRIRNLQITPPAGIDLSSSSSAMWYMCAVIGGELDATGMKINVAQTDLHAALKSMDSTTPNSIVLPWIAPWIELTRSEENGTTEVKTKDKASVRFRPQGVMLRIKLGIRAYQNFDMKINGPLVIQSNAFDDEGSFDLSPSSITSGDDMPKWTPKSGQQDAFLKYNLDSPYTIEHYLYNEDADQDKGKTYLVWIMPKAGVTTPETQIYLGGRFIIEWQYTPYLLTDYKAKPSTAALQNGQIRSLTAQVTEPVDHPLDYSSPGGEQVGVVYGDNSHVSYFKGTIGPGVHIPTLEEASSIFPYWKGGSASQLVNPWSANKSFDVEEVVKWGKHPIQTYKSDFTTIVPPLGAKGAGGRSPGITYAIRYKNTPFCSAWKYEWTDIDNSNGATLRVSSCWSPPWESIDLDMIMDKKWWEDNSERVISRDFKEFIGHAISVYDSGYGANVGPQLTYWGMKEDGEPFIFGTMKLGESKSSVGTTDDIADFLTTKRSGGTGQFEGLSLMLLPFVDKRVYSY